MKRIVSVPRSAPLLVDVPAPAISPRGVLVQVAFSAVSVGTERTQLRSAQQSLLGKARSRPDQVRQVLERVMRDGLGTAARQVTARLEQWGGAGYSCAGIVIGVGAEVADYRVGDRVACGGADAGHAEYCCVPHRLTVKVPDPVPLEFAAFTTIGAIAMQGCRQAEVSLGERVGVIGLGVVGQIACQILRAAGCRVVAMDLDPERVELARACGAHECIVIGRDNVSARVSQMSDGMGLDSVLVTAATKSSEPALLAIDLCRDRGRLVIVGDVGLDIPRAPMYAKELELRLSRSYGPGRYDPNYEERGIDYPPGHVRWTEQRNMQAVLELMASKALDMEPLISHRFTIDQAADAYAMMGDERGRNAIGVLFEYPDQKPPPSDNRMFVKGAAIEAIKDPPGIGFIGAGAFARSVLIPALKKTGARCRGIASASGTTATEISRRDGFDYATSDYHDLLNDDQIDCVFIVTQHDSHAHFVVEALHASKHVFVEKPLATTLEDLERVCEAQRESGKTVMVGFNRRFSPHATALVHALGSPHGPAVVTVRVNAGALPSGHWSLAPDKGGGRIVGEACHFVDLIQFLAGQPIESVYASSLPSVGGGLEESIVAIFRLADGSSAGLNYNAIGDASVPKEYIEVFCDGKVGIIDDFSLLRLGQKKRSKIVLNRRDKGHEAEVGAFIQSLVEGAPSPIPLDEAARVTLATLAILESARTGDPIELR